MINDYDFMVKNGVACGQTSMSHSIESCKDDLKRSIKNLKPMGSTALGPGMLTAIAMAGEG